MFFVFQVFCVFCGNTAKDSQNTAKHPQNTTKHPQNTTKHHKTHLLTNQPEFANKPVLARQGADNWEEMCVRKCKTTGRALPSLEGSGVYVSASACKSFSLWGRNARRFRPA